jgi:hypothetical protein
MSRLAQPKTKYRNNKIMNANRKAYIDRLPPEDLAKALESYRGKLAETPDDPELKEAVDYVAALLANPSNRGIKPGMIKVRANEALNEDGHHDKGSEFEVPESRVAALGTLVTKLAACLLGVALLALSVGTAHAQQFAINGVFNGGSNNFVKAGVASNYNTSTYYIPCTKYQEVAITWGFKLTGAGTTASKIVLTPTADGTNYSTVTTDFVVMGQLGNGTTQVTIVSNLPCGSFAGWKINYVTNGTPDQDMTNHILYYTIKPKRFGSLDDQRFKDFAAIEDRQMPFYRRRV